MPTTLFQRGGWVIACVLAIALLGSLGRVAMSGPLDPPGAPAPTMHTLGDIPPSWHMNLSSSGSDPCHTERFECVLGNAAVLDHETGLVWERAITGAALPWYGAFNTCVGRTTGGETGWRLPEIEELMSLGAPGQTSPALPAGHPFDVGALAEEAVWSATAYWADASRAMDFYLGSVGGSTGAFSHESPGIYYWCVRGPGGVQ